MELDQKQMMVAEVELPVSVTAAVSFSEMRPAAASPPSFPLVTLVIIQWI